MLRRFVSWRAPGTRPGPGEEGVAALEFAIVAPLFLALVFGIIVYGLYITVWIGATEAASEGARASVAGLSAGERAQYATAQADLVIGAYGPLMSGCVPTPAASGAASYQVTVSCNLANLGLSMFSALLPVPGTTLTATAIVADGG